MKEAVFNTEIRKSLELVGHFSHKLTDSIRGPNTRFIPEKPFDIVSCSPRGVFTAVEGKQIKKWCGLTRSMLRPNQIASLDRTVKNRGKAYLMLNVRIPKERVNLCYIFDWKVHRKAILKNEYKINLVRMGIIADIVLEPYRDDQGHILWDLSCLATM